MNSTSDSANQASPLNVTNGDSAVDALRSAGIAGELLPWRDVLHEGPVPDLDDAALAKRRADFIAARGWSAEDEALAGFRVRDAALEQALENETAIHLWFECDLYDQLQLCQVVERIARYPAALDKCVWFDQSGYVAERSPEELRSQSTAPLPLMLAQLSAAKRFWAAFRAGDPRDLATLGRDDLAAWPFLAAARDRLLEEYPDPETGLNRTQRTILELLAAAPKSAGVLFRAAQETEQYRFMGDWSFFVAVAGLSDIPEPLLLLEDEPFSAADAQAAHRLGERRFRITACGQLALRGEANWLEIAQPDHWIGGVRQSPGRYWTWSAEKSLLARV